MGPKNQPLMFCESHPGGIELGTSGLACDENMYLQMYMTYIIDVGILCNIFPINYDVRRAITYMYMHV